jgi:hypothetical protein
MLLAIPQLCDAPSRFPAQKSATINVQIRKPLKPTDFPILLVNSKPEIPSTATVHRFRSSFRDLAGNDYPSGRGARTNNHVALSGRTMTPIQKSAARGSTHSLRAQQNAFSS